MDACEYADRDPDKMSHARFREELLERLDEGRRQLDEGDYVEFDKEGLRRFFDGLIVRAARANERK